MPSTRRAGPRERPPYRQDTSESALTPPHRHAGEPACVVGMGTANGTSAFTQMPSPRLYVTLPHGRRARPGQASCSPSISLLHRALRRRQLYQQQRRLWLRHRCQCRPAAVLLRVQPTARSWTTPSSCGRVSDLWGCLDGLVRTSRLSLCILGGILGTGVRLESTEAWGGRIPRRMLRGMSCRILVRIDRERQQSSSWSMRTGRLFNQAGSLSRLEAYIGLLGVLHHSRLP